MNVVQTWLYLIGTPERAARLLEDLWQLDGKRHRGCGGLVKQKWCTRCESHIPHVLIRTLDPPPDPIAVLDGKDVVELLYAQQDLTAAFDAWDTQQLNQWDMMRFAQWIVDGKYSGPAFDPAVALQQRAERASRDAASPFADAGVRVVVRRALSWLGCPPSEPAA